MRWLLLLAALPALGQDLTAGTDIPPDEWRAMTENRTVRYDIDGQFWALERYGPGNTVTLEISNGECLEGLWYHEPETRGYCFAWENEPTVCFRHIRSEGEIFILSLQSDEVQTVESIDDSPLACGPALIG